MYVFHDTFGNTAKIEGKMIFPYKGAPRREKAFVLSLTADYDDNFLYHVSVYETMQDAMDRLSKFSCNTWKQAD